MRRAVLFCAVSLFLVMQEGPAASKELPAGPVAVMTPQGHVFLLKGADARQFVNDANSLQCKESCDSPEAAAQVAGGVSSERYLIAFEGWGGGTNFNWTAAQWFYPSTKEEPAYFVWPNGVGDGRGAWSEWQEATPRMERLVLRASSSAPLPLTAPPPLQALTGVGSAIAILGLLLVHVSRPRFSARGRSAA